MDVGAGRLQHGCLVAGAVRSVVNYAVSVCVGAALVTGRLRNSRRIAAAFVMFMLAGLPLHCRSIAAIRRMRRMVLAQTGVLCSRSHGKS